MLQDELLPRDQSLVLMMGVSSNEYLLATACSLHYTAAAAVAAVDADAGEWKRRGEKRKEGEKKSECIESLAAITALSSLSLHWTSGMQENEHTRT